MAGKQQISTGEISFNTNGSIQQTFNKEEAKKKIAAAKERDMELIEGTFENIETPGGTLFFGFKAYPGDNIKQYRLEHGQIYRLPRSVVRHLIQNCFVYEYSYNGSFSEAPVKEKTPYDGVYNPLNQGQDKRTLKKKVYRFAFRTLDFRDDELSFNRTPVIEME